MQRLAHMPKEDNKSMVKTPWNPIQSKYLGGRCLWKQGIKGDVLQVMRVSLV